ncbi:MAG: DUF5011 domain-containing protein, partial [Pedosphaera sp.]|nr:DUF5011 domain-containing protein [Pedosphaera sp.]
AINGCTNGYDLSFTTDQRGVGFPRVLGSYADIGAVEGNYTPTVITLAASGVTNSNARLNGTVNPNGFATTAWFEWGSSTSYGNTTPPVAFGSGSTTLSFSNDLSGFTQGITNHYRLVATNSAGTNYGSDIAFGSPIITLLGAANLTNECHFAFTDPGANNSAGFSVAVSGSVNPNSPNNYILTYTGTNTLGGVGTATRTVVVNDTLPPVVTLLGANSVTILTNSTFVEPGATMADACDATATFVTNNTVNVAVIGIYTNSFIATDAAGNSNTAIRVVIVRGPQTNIVTTVADDGGAGTLRSVIANSLSGDSVEFSNTLSGQTILLTSGQLMLNKNLTIDASALTNGITVDGNASGRVFNVLANNTVTLTAMTITNGAIGGFNSVGAGIRNAGNLTVNRCSILGNNSYYSGNGGEAGGIYNEGTIVINQCTFSKNDAYQGGSAIWNDGTAIVSQSTIAGNNGIGVVNYDLFIPNATLTISNSIIQDNVYGTIGGENNLLGGNPKLATLGSYGGTTPTMPPLPSSPAIDGCTNGTSFTTDQRGVGFPRVVGSFADIGAVESGGLFTAAGRIVTVNSDVIDADFVNGVSLREAILYATNGTTITFTNTLSGASIVLTNGELTLDKNLTIDAGTLPNGISIDGNNSSRVILVKPNQTVVLNGLTITNGTVPNGCLDSYYFNGGQPVCVVGGGIANEGTLTMNRCTVSGCQNNIDGGRGAGIYNFGVLTLNQCTVASNIFNTVGYGIGIFNDGWFTLNQSTLSGNHSDNSGSTLYNSGAVTLFNSIVAGNSAGSGPNIGGSFTSTGTNLTTGNPLLAPLGNYGGPSPTMPPLTNSPAIDAGSDSATNSFATDQRGVGFPRSSGTHVDIGAVEYQFVVQVIIATNAPVLTDLTKLGNGSFQFSFTNLPGASFTVFASTNVALPFAQWSNLGAPVESPAGTFQFTDPQATNNTQRFYRVRSP